MSQRAPIDAAYGPVFGARTMVIDLTCRTQRACSLSPGTIIFKGSHGRWKGRTILAIGK